MSGNYFQHTWGSWGIRLQAPSPSPTAIAAMQQQIQDAQTDAAVNDILRAAGVPNVTAIIRGIVRDAYVRHGRAAAQNTLRCSLTEQAATMESAEAAAMAAAALATARRPTEAEAQLQTANYSSQVQAVEAGILREEQRNREATSRGAWSHAAGFGVSLPAMRDFMSSEPAPEPLTDMNRDTARSVKLRRCVSTCYDSPFTRHCNEDNADAFVQIYNDSVPYYVTWLDVEVIGLHIRLLIMRLRYRELDKDAPARELLATGTFPSSIALELVSRCCSSQQTRDNTAGRRCIDLELNE